uniref:Longitudinals lacking protein, isoforms A/B/D/L n=2 Tax=Lygus hesperus TaxID=30085 RepID=A0A0A9ZBF2_LYGHE
MRCFSEDFCTYSSSTFKFLFIYFLTRKWDLPWNFNRIWRKEKIRKRQWTMCFQRTIIRFLHPGYSKIANFFISIQVSTYVLTALFTLLPFLAFNCPNCPKSYKRRDHLKRHYIYECGVERKFGCEFCSYRGKHKAHIISHYVHKHQFQYQHRSYFKRK